MSSDGWTSAIDESSGKTCVSASRVIMCRLRCRDTARPTSKRKRPHAPPNSSPFFDRYYVNTLTNTTQWEAPPGFGAADWTAAVDAGSGKTYYYNARTNVTQWEAPPGFSDSGASAAAAAPAVTTAPAKAVAAPRAAVQRRAVVVAQEEEPKTVRFDARCNYLPPISVSSNVRPPL